MANATTVRSVKATRPTRRLAALRGDIYFNEVDGEIGIRGVLVVTNDGQIGSVTATHRPDPARPVAAAPFCLVESFIDKANSSFQRDLGE